MARSKRPATSSPDRDGEEERVEDSRENDRTYGRLLSEDMNETTLNLFCELQGERLLAVTDPEFRYMADGTAYQIAADLDLYFYAQTFLDPEEKRPPELQRVAEDGDKLAKLLMDRYWSGNWSDPLPDLIEDKTETPEDLTKSVKMARRSRFNDKTATRLLWSNVPTTLAMIDGAERYVIGVERGTARVYMAQTYHGEAVTGRHLTGDDMLLLETLGRMCVKWALRGDPAPWTVSVDEVWRALHGLTGTTRHPNRVQRAALIDSFCRLCDTKIWIDTTREEPPEEGYDWESPAIPEEYRELLDGGRIFVPHVEGFYGEAKTRRGRLVPSFYLRATPVLFCYLLSRGHLIDYDAGLLAVQTKGAQIGENTVAIRRYLIGEIARMYRRGLPGGRDSNRILLETMYTDGGILSPEERTEGRTYKTEASRANSIQRMAADDRREMERACEEWREAGWIGETHVVKHGPKIVGIEVELLPENFDHDSPKRPRGKGSKDKKPPKKSS